MWRSVAFILCVLLAALATWATFDPGAEPADFVIAASEPRTVDPHRVSWVSEVQLAQAMFEGLTRLNDQTFLPEPAVATHWEIDDQHRSYVFYLRPDARWSNGEPVTAADFRYSWLRVLDPRTEAQYATLMVFIRGAEEYYRSRLNDDPDDDVPADAVGIEALDPATLRVSLSRPCSYFLELTAFIAFAPVHRASVERSQPDGGRGSAQEWTRPGNMVSNGPFVMAEWGFKRSIRLKRNPHYWDAASIGIDSIEALHTPDASASLVAYQTGRVHLISPVERLVAERLLKEQASGRRSDFHAGDRFATFFYRVNCRRPPLDSADFRKALSLAIDREAICSQLLRTGETPALHYVPLSGVPLMERTDAQGRPVRYEPPAGLGAGLSCEERVALAREYLRRSGVGSPATVRPIRILFPGEAEQRLLAEAIQQMWQRDLGIRVELQVTEPKVISTRIRALDYDVARSNWFGDYLDPSTFLEMFQTDSGNNRTGWSHPEYDRLVVAATHEPDDGERYRLLAAAEKILVEDELPILPVYFRRGGFLLSPRFEGLADNVKDVLFIHRVRPAAPR